MLLTPEKAVNCYINNHPSRYASSSWEISKLLVYNQIFNVNGNGIRDDAEFKDHLRNRRKNVHTPPAKYLNGEPLFWGYTRLREIKYGDKTFAMVDTDSGLPGVFTEDEKQYHPEVVKWQDCPRIEEFIPYPNFNKNYSIVWRIDTAILTPEWIDEIIWFYHKCEEFFNSDRVHEYHSALPKDPIKLENRVKDQDAYLEKYKKAAADEKECWSEITKAYGVEYQGDTLDFMQRRWNKEHTRIREFISETIEMLESLKTKGSK
jgi:hypothetical protein